MVLPRARAQRTDSRAEAHPARARQGKPDRGKARARRAPGGRSLDMRCRVEGCKNISRGPRFGYICDKHRSELTAKQQREARAKWNAAHGKKAA